MMIAIVSDDGKNISAHFGRAPYYVVLTVAGGKVTGRETREKAAHGRGLAAEPHVHHGPGHGLGPAEHSRHLLMAQPIADCEAVICGGMGQGAHDSLTARGLRPIITDLDDMDAAALAYAGGTIVDHVERVH